MTALEVRMRAGGKLSRKERVEEAHRRSRKEEEEEEELYLQRKLASHVLDLVDS